MRRLLPLALLCLSACSESPIEPATPPSTEVAAARILPLEAGRLFGCKLRYCFKVDYFPVQGGKIEMIPSMVTPFPPGVAGVTPLDGAIYNLRGQQIATFHNLDLKTAGEGIPVTARIANPVLRQGDGTPVLEVGEVWLVRVPLRD